MANDAGLTAATPEVFEQYPLGSFAVAGSPPIPFAVIQVTESGGNRIVKHERPFRDGAKLDDTGTMPRSFRIVALYDNGLEEPGIPEDPPLYPNLLNALILAFAKHETGDLVLPTRGSVRARAQTYERDESASDRDQAKLTMTFLEDNEDTVDAASLGAPTVRASARRLSEHTVFSASSEGMTSANLNSLTDTLSEIQGLLATPGEALDALTAQIRKTRRSLEAVEEQGEALGKLVGGILSDPHGAAPVRELRKLSDLLAGAEDERSRSRSRVLAYRVRQSMSIYTVARLTKQRADKLMDLNAGRLPDMLRIEAGTVVRIYDRFPG